MSARERGERIRIGDAARGLLGRLDRGGHLERARAVAAWQEVAGEEVTRHATGFAMRDRELIVFVDSPVWATELSSLSERYRTEINARVGQDLVGTIRFTVSKQAAEGRKWHEVRNAQQENPDLVQPVPATDEEIDRLQALAESVHDESLREAAVRAAKRDLEWRKGLAARKKP